jgi:hypothetical protein
MTSLILCLASPLTASAQPTEPAPAPPPPVAPAPAPPPAPPAAAPAPAPTPQPAPPPAAAPAPAPSYGYGAPPPEAAPPDAGSGAFAHDGFYLRLGIGFTYASDSLESETVTVCFSSGCADGKIEGTISGLGAATEIALGGTVAPGLVIGGGIYNHVIPGAVSDDLSFGGVSIDEDVEFETTLFTLYGPFVDYYFDPLSGFHLQGSIGLAMLATGKGEFESSGTAVEEQTATGVGIMVGVGHEWWVGEQWSVGILGRVTYGSLTGKDDDDVEWSHSVLAPAVLFTATMH